ncbi:hypothetical protein BB560_001773 [Smittium megazygosporum]|uniref:SGNH hydrolase-type esterase domain-containing protein n=1 Tax=Smittium megazygosporum TaxID=133381 RepID=A0A2T9ZGU4_9FUNG|nr:hypothetical protein BB560_001773 [Smittium megazygosporum]
MISLTFLLSISVTLFASRSEASPSPRLVVFGTSLSDNGNTNVTTPIPWWNHHYSNGPVWGEYLAYYNNYTLYDFACYSAVSDNKMVKDYTGSTVTVPSLLDQVDKYEQAIKPYYNASDIAQDIAVIEIGSNDIFNAALQIVLSSINTNRYINTMVSNAMSAANQLANLGHRNIYLTTIPDVNDIPSLSLFPSIVTRNIRSAVLNYNLRLKIAVNSFKFPDSEKGSIAIVDMYKIVDVTTNGFYKNLNIRSISSPCYVAITSTRVSSCQNSDDYLFMDKAHPSTRIHSLFAGVFAEVIANPSFGPTSSSLSTILPKYQVLAASSKSNFLYKVKNNNASGLVVTSYTSRYVVKNAESLYTV